MADSIIVADTVTILGATWQPLDQVLDIAAYDTLDLQFGLVGLKGASAAGATIKLYTSMLNVSDDVSATGPWSLMATVSLSGASGTPEWTTKGIATTVSAPMLRYLRWYADLLANSTAATFSILGLARPR